MNIQKLLKIFLIEECEFKKTQIETKTYGSKAIIVYAGGNKLHFLIEGFKIDCCFMYGGMSIPISHDGIISCVFPWTDLRDPKSLQLIKEKLSYWIEQNLSKRVQSSTAE